jgi:hypothetical protein
MLGQPFAGDVLVVVALEDQHGHVDLGHVGAEVGRLGPDARTAAMAEAGGNRGHRHPFLNGDPRAPGRGPGAGRFRLQVGTETTVALQAARRTRGTPGRAPWCAAGYRGTRAPLRSRSCNGARSQDSGFLERRRPATLMGSGRYMFCPGRHLRRHDACVAPAHVRRVERRRRGSQCRAPVRRGG